MGAHRSSSSSARSAQDANRSPVLALVEIGADDALDVVGETGADVTLCARSLRPNPASRPDAATEVHLEPLDVVAVVVGDELALEPDVGDLDPGAGVRAAVEVHA